MRFREWIGCPFRRLGDRTRERHGNGPVVPDKIAANRAHAARAVRVLSGHVRRDFLQIIILLHEPDDRIVVGDRLYLAVLDCVSQQVAGARASLHVVVGIDDLPGKQNREKVLRRVGHVPDADGLAHQVREVVDAACFARQQTDAAAGQPEHDLDVEYPTRAV